MTAAEVVGAHLPELSQPVTLHRPRPQDCDSSWSCKFDREEIAKAEVVGRYENAGNTVQYTGAAKKALTHRKPEA